MRAMLTANASVSRALIVPEPPNEQDWALRTALSLHKSHSLRSRGSWDKINPSAMCKHFRLILSGLCRKTSQRSCVTKKCAMH